jgi:hypothetical protein
MNRDRYAEMRPRLHYKPKGAVHVETVSDHGQVFIYDKVKKQWDNPGYPLPEGCSKFIIRRPLKSEQAYHTDNLIVIEAI